MELLRIHAVDGDQPVLELDGEIDLSTAEELRVALDKAASADPRVVVDMAGVTFCDVAGVRVLLQVATSLNGSGPLKLRNAGRVKWLLGLVGMSEVSSIVIGDELGT